MRKILHSAVSVLFLLLTSEHALAQQQGVCRVKECDMGEEEDSDPPPMPPSSYESPELSSLPDYGAASPDYGLPAAPSVPEFDSEPAVVRRRSPGLIIAGSILLGGAYTASAAGAAYVYRESPSRGEKYYPLYIPLAGPFIAMETSRARNQETVLLALDGVTQSAGLTLLIVGLVKRSVVVSSQQPLHVYPLVGAVRGLGMTWRM